VATDAADVRVDAPAPEHEGGRARRRDTDLHLFRLVPGSSVVHRLWAGTKIVCLVILSVAVSISPTWPTIGVVAAILAIGVALARIPLGAAPRIPRWFVFWVLVGGALSLWSNVPPTFHVGGVLLSLGGFDEWARFVLLAFLLVLGAAIIGWTTPAGEFAPALARLARPFRWLPLPIDEWLVSVALSVRCFPLLIDEIRTMLQVRRLRAREHKHIPRRDVRARLRVRTAEAIDLLSAAVVTSLRRADEMADAIEARAGLGNFSDSRARPGALDYAVVVAVIAIAVATLVLL
jgi:energy-coupling factor transporter transmembrane protein EcfT